MSVQLKKKKKCLLLKSSFGRRRSRWQGRRTWSSPPPNKYVKNTSTTGTILTEHQLKVLNEKAEEAVSIKRKREVA